MSNSGHAQDLVTTAEASRILRVTVASVNRYVRVGKLAVAVKSPGVRGANHFIRSDVEALSESLAEAS
jgi:predicted site-specific integrase-resolvase